MAGNRGLRIGLAAGGVVAALAITGVALTAGSASFEAERRVSAADLPDEPGIDCDELDTGGVVRAPATATGCAFRDEADTAESGVRLVATCRLSGSSVVSPVAHGDFADGIFQTLPCAFGVSEAEFETGSDIVQDQT